MIVTYQHAKEINYCNKGLRKFCADHGIDYQDFKANGISSEALLTMGDAMCDELVDHAMKQTEGDTE